jgi:protein translocation Sec62 family protein
MLALRVVKSDPHEGHDHAPPSKKQGKRAKGLWTVRIEPQQEAGDDMYYVWLWEGSQVMRKVYAALALAAIFAIVCYPLWPVKLRQGGYYLSWGFLCFMGLFFAMAIFRVILFCITYFILSPGFWLFPNLWEDVSVVDSFKPVWAWHEVCCPVPVSRSHLLTAPSRPPTRKRRRPRSRRAARPPPARPSPLRLASLPPRLLRLLLPLHRSPQLRSSAVTWHRGLRSWRMTSDCSCGVRGGTRGAVLQTKRGCACMLSLTG